MTIRVYLDLKITCFSRGLSPILFYVYLLRFILKWNPVTPPSPQAWLIVPVLAGIRAGGSQSSSAREEEYAVILVTPEKKDKGEWRYKDCAIVRLVDPYSPSLRWSQHDSINSQYLFVTGADRSHSIYHRFESREVEGR